MPNTQSKRTETSNPPLVGQLIDALMAQPIKAQPAITIFGDDDVTGFDPPKDTLRDDTTRRV